MDDLHVIVGGGPVGTATARALLDRGARVRVVTRHGTGPDGTEPVAADATDADRLTALTEGAAALYNCASPQYHRWLTDWPPLAASLLTTAERTGAVLATASNLYGYGPVVGPITADTPLAATHPKLRLRAEMWRAALAAHEAGRVRATEVRASDYIEANSLLAVAVAGPVTAGRRAYVPARLDQPHTWTSIRDVARTLVTAATTERAWGHGWLVPSNDPLTVRELATRYAEVTGAGAPKLTAMPYPVLWVGGLVSPLVRELRTTYYQWDRPFTMHADLTTRTFGIEPTPLDEALAAVDTTPRTH
ncbi:NAD-dependent epimerase/dehydratase family protein [Actinocatenispora rupis]|uniref:NAD-dependent epimerase n=1 Tax=Actinocatenispora rupis TaxID=519421 RepID=A0A8J3N906_9ACTN|nr:NAD-dependent epimerase/dehydratase family protein [Actinocatenispora rupis]GID10864.1 NAD-dependent epimerase [Actinocatenispora rupis]